MKNKVIGVCPNCGNSVVEREKGYFCENRECRFVLWKDNAFFKRLGKRMDAHVADRLLRDGRVRLKDCKSSKARPTMLLSCCPPKPMAAASFRWNLRVAADGAEEGSNLPHQ